MTTDIDNLIAEALKFDWGDEQFRYEMAHKLIVALESRQTTTHEKIAQSLYDLRLAGTPSPQPWSTLPDWAKARFEMEAHAILATDIFVDADKIAADAKADALQGIFDPRTPDAALIEDARKWPRELEGNLINELADRLERITEMLEGSHARETAYLNRALTAENFIAPAPTETEK